MQESAGLQRKNGQVGPGVSGASVWTCAKVWICDRVRPTWCLYVCIHYRERRGVERNEAGEEAVGEGACATSMWGGKWGDESSQYFIS